jgi:hypothetical protein
VILTIAVGREGFRSGSESKSRSVNFGYRTEDPDPYKNLTDLEQCLQSREPTNLDKNSGYTAPYRFALLKKIDNIALNTTVTLQGVLDGFHPKTVRKV